MNQSHARSLVMRYFDLDTTAAVREGNTAEPTFIETCLLARWR